MTTDLPSILGLSLFAWSFTVASVSLEAARRTWVSRFRQTKRANAPSFSGVSVLVVRPCAGHEATLERTLSSLAKAKRSFALRCRFAIEGPSDTAVAAATRAVEALQKAGIEAEIVFTGGGGPNRKAAQLAVAASGAAILVACDSDVDLEGVDLDQLVAPLVGAGGTWVSWAPPAERGSALTLGDLASAAVLGGSLHAFPLLAQLDPAGLVGKLFAIRQEALSAIGGFGSLVDYLGEDMEIARRVREQGGAVVAVPLVARSLAAGRSWDVVVGRFARWLTVIRAQRAFLLLSYPALFFATVPIVLVSALLAFVAPTAALVSAFLAITARLGVAWLAASIAGRKRGPLQLVRDVALADGMLAAAFVRALGTRTVTWRDRVLVVDRTGLLHEPSALKS